ncbi:MAG: cyclodeaminase/cyclohydrolase family protein [Ignavibacteria bacterium]|nr:cyclodeaminase/cyclohydrolase family protein [Ignavibacteria bacterium]
MNITKTIEEYLQELSSNSPTPGGGNVAALCGSLAASLGTMVCNLTVGKKKYAPVEEEVVELRKKIEAFQMEFVTLGKEDNAAFDEVMVAFKLPKETDEEKAARNTAIDNATLGAAKIPANVVVKCGELLPLLVRISEIGNQNSLSDAAVGIALTRTAAEGALLNVLINCSALSDSSMYADVLRVADSAYDQIQNLAGIKLTEIMTKLRPQQ